MKQDNKEGKFEIEAHIAAISNNSMQQVMQQVMHLLLLYRRSY